MNKKRTRTTFFRDRLCTRPSSTQEGIKNSLINFDKFCKKNFGIKNCEIVIDRVRKISPTKRYDRLWDILQDWVNWNQKNNRSPSTIRRYFSGVNRFLNYKGLKITPNDVRENLDLPARIVEEKQPVTRDGIQKIFRIAHPMKKALYLALLSSGMRIGEATSIRKNDLELVRSENGKVRAKVYIHAKISKNNIGRSTFISKEAYSHIENRLAKIGNNDLVWGVNEGRKQAVASEQTTFSRYLKKVGLDKKFESTGRRKISLHSLRAFFFTKASRIDPNFAQLITGHSGYLLREYDQLTTEDKLEIYLRVEPELTIDISEKLKAEKEKIEKEKSILEKGIIQIGSRLRRTDAKVERLLKGMTELDPKYGEILAIRKDGPY